MSAPSPTSENSVRANIWQRIFDKISGEPPDQAKLEILKKKVWFIQYKGTLFFFLISAVLFSVTEGTSYLNRLPDLNNLQTLQVTIIRTNERDPHLLVELPDKSLRNMEWPIPIGLKAKYQSHVWSDRERDRLSGCLATVRGAPIRWTISDRFRIWELDCPEERIHISIEKTIKDSQSWIDISKSSLIEIGIFWILYFLIVFLRERRGNL